MIELSCTNCNKLFDKEFREYKRQIKSGNSRFFCGLSCTRKKLNEENPPPGNISNLISNNRSDEFTSFRKYLALCEYRGQKKKYGCNLDLQFLKQLWEDQNGICPISGAKLILSLNTSKSLPKNPYNASLDRIDNSLGYLKGNVRFISYMANIGKQLFTDQQLIDFCKTVAIYNN